VLVVKDSMVLIHLAATSVLQGACEMFGKIIISPAVHEEVVERGIEIGRPDAYVVKKLEDSKHIGVVTVARRKLMTELARYGLKGGELESVALYFQEKADLIASNDDKVRGLQLILSLNLISSPEIILVMARGKVISKEKALESLLQLKRIGWFSPNVIDMIVEEVRKVD
jgi:predicted nucleic acid-binding protein